MFSAIAFYTLSAASLGLFLVVVKSKNILYSLSSLAAGLALCSGFFFMLGAEFLGAVQIAVYCGAVMGLYGFCLFFFDSAKPVREKIIAPKMILILSICAAALLVAIVGAPVVGENLNAQKEKIAALKLNNIDSIESRQETATSQSGEGEVNLDSIESDKKEVQVLNDLQNALKNIDSIESSISKQMPNAANAVNSENTKDSIESKNTDSIKIPQKQAQEPKELSPTQKLGVVLFTKYLLPFELAAILLLVAMIAAIVLCSKKMNEQI